VSETYHQSILPDYNNPIVINIKFLQIYVWIKKNAQEIDEIAIRNQGTELLRITDGYIKSRGYSGMLDAFTDNLDYLLKKKYEIMNGDSQLITANEQTFLVVLKTLYFVYGEDFLQKIKIRRPNEKEFTIPDAELTCAVMRMRSLLSIFEY
jgi:hypothetical protein